MKPGAKYYFSEGALIVFSVLFALFINNIVAEAQLNTKKKIALESIRKELELNHQILKDWMPLHRQTRDRVVALVEGESDSLLSEMRQEPYFKLALLTGGESLISGIPTKTAWESAINTGIVSEFSFETMRTLTETYALQEEVSGQTLRRILDVYNQMETHKEENLEQVLVQFQIGFWELVGQENLMDELYTSTLEYLQAPGPK